MTSPDSRRWAMAMLTASTDRDPMNEATYEELVRLEAIERWANHAWHQRCTVLEAVEAIVGLAQRIQADSASQTKARSATVGAENESGRATHHTPPAMARPTQEVRRV